MPKHDDTHFDSYTQENETKHRILGGYLPAYLTAIKRFVTAFHYIDGFAGRGSYENSVQGSPLLVIDKLEKAGLLSRTSISLIEERPDYFTELQEAIANKPQVSSLLDKPLIKNGRFSEYIDDLLSRPVYKKPGKVATFAFVDPCGIDGLRMRDMMRVLGKDFGELLLFFNYDGVNRLVGGVEKGTHDSRILAELYGSDAAVNTLLRNLAKKPSPEMREKIIREEFIAQLIANGTRYVVPFRFHARNSARTSHYLIHCCNHCLGFRLMKHVMWDAGKSSQDDYGRLDFVTASATGGQLDLWRPDIDLKKKQILDDLALRQTKVGDYIHDQICRPSDVFCERVYKKMIMELEAAGEIIVYDAKNENPTPQDKRIMRRQKPTLGDDYWLRRS